MHRLFYIFLIFGLAIPSLEAQDITITRIATDLNNPRGVAVMPNGNLLVVEAGTGDSELATDSGTGQVLLLIDVNDDGDFDDDLERTALVQDEPSYNSLDRFGTGHDEPFGLSDIVLMEDGRIFFNKDDPFFREEPRLDDAGYYGNTGVFVLDGGTVTLFSDSLATLNALVYDPDREVFFVTESGFNQITQVDLAGEVEVLANLPALAHGQQPVPSGIALDPTTGDILIALFSGFLKDYHDMFLGFFPGDSKIVRLNPETQALTDEITGLTTAIDIAVDEMGNIFVVELTTVWPAPLMPRDFDLFDPNELPDPGGYVHNTGRVTMFPADGSEPMILADGLDNPTNITYHEGVLYVSTGLGTPGTHGVYK